MDVPEGGVQCEHFWVNGGCGGHDAGRCGVTGDGGLYAYYLDAVAWCQDDNPFCGFRMGPVVYNGCSMAERVGYSHECCFISGHDIQYAVRNECEAIVNFNDDPTSTCPNHHLQVFGASGSTVLFTFGPDGINAPNQAGCDRTAGQWSAGQIAIEPTACVTLEDAGWVNNGINDFAICTDGRGTQSCSGGWCAGCANDEVK